MISARISHTTLKEAAVEFLRLGRRPPLPVEGGRIAELWDLGREVPCESPNEHGMF